MRKLLLLLLLPACMPSPNMKATIVVYDNQGKKDTLQVVYYRALGIKDGTSKLKDDMDHIINVDCIRFSVLEASRINHNGETISDKP